MVNILSFVVLIYVNGMSGVNESNRRLYADGTTLFVADNDISTV